MNFIFKNFWYFISLGIFILILIAVFKLTGTPDPIETVSEKTEKSLSRIIVGGGR